VGLDAVARAGRWAHALATWSARVEEVVAPDAVALVGSYARGTFVDGTSDVDVLVVGGRLPATLQARFMLLAGLAADLAMPIEPLAYSTSEFEAMLGRGHVAVYDALAFGWPLTGVGAWQRWQQSFAALGRRGLRREGHAWRLPAE